jgi:hypothetical protein
MLERTYQYFPGRFHLQPPPPLSSMTIPAEADSLPNRWCDWMTLGTRTVNEKAIGRILGLAQKIEQFVW